MRAGTLGPTLKWPGAKWAEQVEGLYLNPELIRRLQVGRRQLSLLGGRP